MYEFICVQKEQENESTVSTDFEKSSENHYQDPKLLEEITPVPIESDFIKLPSLNSPELVLNAALRSIPDCSVTETVKSSVSIDTVGNSAMVEKDESELNTIEKPVLSEHSEGNQSLISAEPSK